MKLSHVELVEALESETGDVTLRREKRNIKKLKPEEKVVYSNHKGNKKRRDLRQLQRAARRGELEFLKDE